MSGENEQAAMPAEVTNDGIIDLDAPEAEAKVEDNEDKAEGEAEAKTEGEEDRGDGDKPKKPSGAQRAKIREQRLLDETHPRDRELEDKRAAHNQPCVRLIVSIEGNDRLVSIALGERHQVAIRSLATGALVPVAAKEVGDRRPEWRSENAGRKDLGSVQNGRNVGLQKSRCEFSDTPSFGRLGGGGLKPLAPTVIEDTG